MFDWRKAAARGANQARAKTARTELCVLCPEPILTGQLIVWGNCAGLHTPARCCHLRCAEAFTPPAELAGPSWCDTCGERGIVTETKQRNHWATRRYRCRACGARWTTREVRSDRLELLDEGQKKGPPAGEPGGRTGESPSDDGDAHERDRM